MKHIKSHSSSKTIFLTGASGVVGQALLEKLSDHTIICLTHRKSIAAPNIVSLKGDVTQPRFGLSHDEFNSLAQRVDYIVHTAAITDFSRPDEIVSRTNIDGTRNVLELGKIAQAGLFYVSTAFVHPHNQTVDSDITYAYMHSKQEAEQMVRESGLPYTIIRPSIVLGDSQTGVIAKYQGFHLMIGLIVMELLPVLPVSPQHYVDFVPQDLVANVVAELINQDQVGGEWWLTAGDKAMTVGAIVDTGIEYTSRLVGHPIVPPKIVDADVFERLIRPVFLPALPRHMKKNMIRVLPITKTCVARPLPTSLPDLESKLGLTLPFSPEQTLLRNLGRWITMEGDKTKQAELEQTKVLNSGGIN